ncbi:MAG: hypothetical protein QM632_06615 [Micrococcaceae bacterium]
MITKRRTPLFVIGSLIMLGAFAVCLTDPSNYLKGHSGTPDEVVQTILSALFQFFVWQVILFFLLKLGAKNIVFRVIATVLVFGTVAMFIQNPLMINGVTVQLGIKTLMIIGQLLCGIATLSLWLPGAEKKQVNHHELSS